MPVDESEYSAVAPGDRDGGSARCAFEAGKTTLSHPAMMRELLWRQSSEPLRRTALLPVAVRRPGCFLVLPRRHPPIQFFLNHRSRRSESLARAGNELFFSPATVSDRR